MAYYRRRFRRPSFRRFGRRFGGYFRRFSGYFRRPFRRRRRRRSSGSRRIALQLGRWKLTTASLLSLAALGGMGYWLYSSKQKTGKWPWQS
jgi:hypothetical protein